MDKGIACALLSTDGGASNEYEEMLERQRIASSFRLDKARLSQGQLEADPFI